LVFQVNIGHPSGYRSLIDAGEISQACYCQPLFGKTDELRPIAGVCSGVKDDARSALGIDQEAEGILQLLSVVQYPALKHLSQKWLTADQAGIEVLVPSR
jgi:hypothetical protein